MSFTDRYWFVTWCSTVHFLVHTPHVPSLFVLPHLPTWLLGGGQRGMSLVVCIKKLTGEVFETKVDQQDWRDVLRGIERLRDVDTN